MLYQSVLLIPFIGPFPFSLFTARLPYALLGVATVLLLTIITYHTVGAAQAIAVGIMAAINPWNIFFSRTTYDAPVTTFFLLLALYILLKAKGWKILWSIIPLFIAFHTYMGMMVVFIPFVMGILFYAWTTVSNKQSGWKYLAVFAVCLLFVIRFFLTLQHTTTPTRATELLTPWSDVVTTNVNKTRFLSVVNPFIPLYANRAVMFTREVVERYLGAFSPGLLFLYGDPKNIFSIYYYGLFYLTDIIGIVIGFYVLYKKRKSIWGVLLFIICIAPFPSVASNTNISYASCSYLLQPALLIFLGVGLTELFTSFRTKKLKIIGMTLFTVLYAIQISQFSIVYFLRNPIANSDSYNLSARIMARYTYFESKKTDNIVLLADEPKTPFKHFLFFTDAINGNTIRDLSEKFATNNLKIHNITAEKCLSPSADRINTTLIVEGNLTCNMSFPEAPLIIPFLSDGGSIYRIFNGKTCSGMTLGKYPQHITMSDFSVERLSELQFCQTFITKY